MIDTMNVPPYSQCDPKGRCIRHPNIQMSRKKKLGGWKKLLSHCPACAMELIASERDGAVSSDAYCDVLGSAEASPSCHHRNSDTASLQSADRNRPTQCSTSSGSRHRNRGQGSNDDRSLDGKSVRSAPSTYNYNRRLSQDASVSTKRSASSDSASCDTTVDTSLYSAASQSSSVYNHSNGQYPSPRIFRRTDSSGSGSLPSQGSQGSLRSQGSHGSGRSHRSSGSREMVVNIVDPNHEQFVCGMKFSEGCFYTGQIHVETRLPHGLGTLRSDIDGSLLEGEWHFGRLVQESHAAVPPPPLAQEYPCHDNREYEQNVNQYAQKEAFNFCTPCDTVTDLNKGGIGRCGVDTLCRNFHQYTTIQDVQENSRHSSSEDERSSVSNSIAETLHGDDDGSQSSAEWSRESGRSCGSAYSANESKSYHPQPRDDQMSQNSKTTFDKLQEFEKYVIRCDEEQAYYTDDHSGRSGSESYQHSQGSRYERQKKVRFQVDP